MSDFRVLQDISLLLRQTLFEGLRGAGVSANFTSANSVSLASPASIIDKSAPNASQVLVSLYLYQVSPNTFLNNYPPIPDRTGKQFYPPLSLDLFYLLTPFGSSPEENLNILGGAMQIMAANPLVRADFLDSTLLPGDAEVQVIMNPVTLEELTRIWHAFNQPHRLSMCYQVKGISIDSTRAPEESAPVREALLDIQMIMGKGG